VPKFLFLSYSTRIQNNQHKARSLFLLQTPIHKLQGMATATAKPRKKLLLRILLMPFFATSHIGPFTDLAFHLVAARPHDVEATVSVTPANALVVKSALARRGASHQATVTVATYPFPPVDGLPPGVENHSTVKAADAWRIDSIAIDEKLMWPRQESHQEALVGPRHH